MITLKQFRKLKRGDVVLFGKRKVARVVQVGPANFEPPIDSIRFAIMRRSWTNRAVTCYGFNDVKRLLTIPRNKLHTPTIQRANEQALVDIGFNVDKEKRREFKQFLESRKRMARCAKVKFKCSPGYNWRLK